MRATRRTAFQILTVGLLALAGMTRPAFATHFRYTHISWDKVSGNTVEFFIQSSFRRSNSPSFNPCTIRHGFEARFTYSEASVPFTTIRM